MKKILIIFVMLIACSALWSQNNTGLRIILSSKPDTNSYNVFGVLSTQILLINEDSIDWYIGKYAPTRVQIRLAGESEFLHIENGSEYLISQDVYQWLEPIEPGDSIYMTSRVIFLNFLYKKYQINTNYIDLQMDCVFKTGIYAGRSDTLMEYRYSNEQAINISPLNIENKHAFVDMLANNIDPLMYTDRLWLIGIYSVGDDNFALIHHPQSNFAQCAKLRMAYSKYDKNLPIEKKAEIALLLSDGLQSEYSFIRKEAERLLQRIKANK